MTNSISMKTKCPTCKQWTEWENNQYRPFCSERCKLIDLGAWASDEYKIPGENIAVDNQNDEEQ